MAMRRGMSSGSSRRIGWCWLALAGLAASFLSGRARAADRDRFLDAAGTPIAETVVPEDLRVAVQALVAAENRGIDLEKCALVLARVNLPGDETDPHFTSVLHGQDWEGGMHFLATGTPPNAVCIRLSRFDAPCTLELTKPTYRPVSVQVPIDRTRGQIIWLGEIKLERALTNQVARPVPPPAVVAPRQIPEAPPAPPPAPVASLLSKAPDTNRVNNLTYRQLNALFEIPLWASDRLWDEDGETVRQRLDLGVESQGASASSRFSAVGHPKEPILGEKAEEMRVSCNGKLVSSVMIMFANKGDSVPMKPELKEFRKEFNRTDADFRKANQDYEKAMNTFRHRIRVATTNVEAHLTAGLGEHRNSFFGAGGTVQETVKVWSWKDHAILLSEKPGEGVLLRIMPAQDAAKKGAAEPIRSTDLKQELLSHVEHRANGDVVIREIPMVTQGSKGYCVPATCARYLQYFGIPVDEYILAEAAHTAPGGGTGGEIIPVMAGVVVKNHRQLITRNGPLSLALIGEYINQGMPMIWGMSAIGAFEKLGLPPDRMGENSPEDWKEKLKPSRKEAEKLARYKYQGLCGHWCMIIGYNKLTKEVATSDSWGPGAQERWFPLEAVQNVSGDSFCVIHW